MVIGISNSNKSHSRPKAIDLFAGVGGFSLGLEYSGFDIVAAVENDPIAALTYQFNFPQTKVICQDIREVTLVNFKNQDIDLMVGGSPCQGFSQGGKQAINDPRNKLVFEFYRIVNLIKPKYFILENVPAIAKFPIYQELISKFNYSGYNTLEPTILNSFNYGVAQLRKRIFLIGYRDGCNMPKYPEINNFFRYPDDVMSDLEWIDPFIDVDHGILPNLLFSDIEPLNNYAHKRSKSLIYGHKATNHSNEVKLRFSRTKPGTKEPISRFNRLHPQEPSLTLRAGTGRDRGRHTAPKPIHYNRDRCITIREAARLQSFPDWFQFHDTKWHGFRQIGNSVCPFVAHELANSIICAIYDGWHPSFLINKIEEQNCRDVLFLNENKAREVL